MSDTSRAAAAKDGGRAEPLGLEDRRHLGDRQPFGKRDRDLIDLAARDLVR